MSTLSTQTQIETPTHNPTPQPTTQTQTQQTSAETQGSYDANADIKSRAEFVMNVLYIDYVQLWLRKPADFVAAPKDGPLPVIRIFGATEAGQHAVLHVHGYLPYLYFRPASPEDSSFSSELRVRGYLPVFQTALEKRLQEHRIAQMEASKRKGSASAGSRLVDRMEVVQRTSIYGLQGPQWFVRVFLRKPTSVKQCRVILEAGRMLGDGGVPMATWEAHIPYTLQFTSDLNIKPTGWLYLDTNLRLRSPLPTLQEALQSCGPSLRQGNNAEVRDGLICQGSVPSSKLWDVEAEMAEGIEDFSLSQVFTQSLDKVRVPVVQPREHPSLQLPGTSRVPYEPSRNGTYTSPRNNLTFKDSTSLLELDAPWSAILNAYLIVPSFGAELWEAEARRRQRCGMTADSIPVPPTQAPPISQQHVTAESAEWAERFNRLRRKGKILRGEPDDINASASPILSAVSLQSQIEQGDIIATFLMRSAEELTKDPAGNSSQVYSEDFVRAEMQLLSGSQRDKKDEERHVMPTEPPAPEHVARQFDNDDDEGDGEAEQSVQQELQAIFSSTQMPEALSPPREIKSVKDTSMRGRIDLFTLESANPLLISDSKQVNTQNPVGLCKDAKHLPKRGRKRAIGDALGHRRHVETSPLPKQGIAVGSGIKKLHSTVHFSPSPNFSDTQSVPSVSDSPALTSESIILMQRKYTLLKPAGAAPTFNKLAAMSESGLLGSINQSPYFSDIKHEPGGAQPFSSDYFKREHASRASYRSDTCAFYERDNERGCAVQRLLEKAVDLHWQCTVCTLVNETQVTSCIMCNSHRVLHAETIPSRKRLLVPVFLAPTIAELCPLPAPKIESVTQLSSPDPSTDRSMGLLPAPVVSCNDNNTAEPCARFTLTSLEVHMKCRPPLLPDPEHDHDTVELVVYATDDVRSGDELEARNRTFGILAVIDKSVLPESKAFLASAGLPLNTVVDIVRDEKQLLIRLANRLSALDPDVLCGYEIQRSSLGLLLARAEHLGIPLRKLISRMPNENPSLRAEHDEGYAADHDSGIFLTGRFVLNLWRRMKAELKLNNYSIGNVSWHLLKTAVPQFSHAQLHCWYNDPKQRFRTIRHIFRLAEVDLRMLEEMDLVRRTCESARLYGIDFFSVLTRGSQYRVEAAMLARAHARGFILLSPQAVSVARQASLEHIALILEPRSAFYADPVVVLDFQSLYPSMCIAHNLCYSTIFAKLLPGRGASDETTGRLGAINYPEAQASLAAAMHDNGYEPYVSPSGAVFASPFLRVGVLPSMLKEILSTRRMVQRAMATCKAGGKTPNKVLYRVLDARQLAIKLLANVTYGYTAAAFSGRMPMSELADAIVSSGRGSLQEAMSLVRRTTEWGPLEIVYGDTDSMFVHLHGRTRQEAFAVGRQIAATITSRAPENVALKFEKVYHPCVLVAKKRYTGHMFETEGQEDGSLDVKGLECVRRDQCPATQKIQEKVLRTLFVTRDLSLVREYICSQFSRLLLGAQGSSVRDFVFSKEVKLGHYRNENLEPPGAVLARRQIADDHRQHPPNSWRVPYVICSKAPGTQLKYLVECPLSVLKTQRSDDPLHINGRYYVEKCVLPALERVLVLCGGDIRQWYSSMTRPRTRRRLVLYPETPGRGNFASKTLQKTMDVYVNTPRCLLCGIDAVPNHNLCRDCLGRLDDGESVKGMKLGSTVATLSRKLNAELAAEAALAKSCRACTLQSQDSQFFYRGEPLGPDCCSNIDCKVFLSRCRRVLFIEDVKTALSEANCEVHKLQW